MVHLVQRTAYDLLLQSQPDNAVNRIRHKIERWKMPDPISLLARRALDRLQRAFTLAAPRVAVVLFGSYWNRWCTARRFQEEGTCVFGCLGLGKDSIEHYAICPIQTNFATNFLHIPPRHTSTLMSFFALDPNISDTLLTILMLNLYTCYTARNKLKHAPLTLDSSGYVRFFTQIAKQGTFGHSASQKILDSYLSNRV